MRSDLRPDSDNLFERRAMEKDAQRAALFGPKAADSAKAKAYVLQQAIEKPQRISVGKPAFAARF